MYPKMMYLKGWSDTTRNTVVTSEESEREARNRGYKNIDEFDDVESAVESKEYLQELYFKKTGEMPDKRWSIQTLKENLNDL